MAQHHTRSRLPDRRPPDSADDQSCPPSSSTPAMTSAFPCSVAAISPTTSLARGISKSTAPTMLPGLPNPTRSLTEIEEFLTGGHAAPSPSHRALRTVLFTDIVASTQLAAAAGDERWRAVLQRFGQITAEVTERFGGTVVKSTGDGHLITFDGPTQAIRCAEALRDDTEKFGIHIRVGIHTGRVRTDRYRHRRDRRPYRRADPRPGRCRRNPRLPHRPRPGRRLGHRPSSTAASFELRGVPGTWQLLAVEHHGCAGGNGLETRAGFNAHARSSDRDAPVGPRPRGGGQASTLDASRDGSP